MGAGDNKRSDNTESSVRILPADGSQPVVSGPTQDVRPRRWFAPVLAVVAVLGVFVVATRPTDSADVTTTAPQSPIAALDAELIDLRSGDGESMHIGWAADDPIDGTITDVLHLSGKFIAVGYGPSGAKVWHSGSGRGWREATLHDLPSGSRTSIDQAVPWNGNVIALGSVDDVVGLWTSRGVLNWQFQGRLDTFGSSWVTDLVAGPSLLAVSRIGDGQMLGWTSTNGTDWDSAGYLFPVDGPQIEGVAANDEWFIAHGTIACLDQPCPGVVYRSRDGLVWEEAARFEPGMVFIDVVATDRGLFALGRTGSRARTPALWTSQDGTEWSRLGEESQSLRDRVVTVHIESTATNLSSVAQLSVDGRPIEATVGTKLDTDVGILTVSEITEDTVTFNDAAVLNVGEALGLEATMVPTGLHAEGPRIIVHGSIHWLGEQHLATWTSVDGAIWSLSPLNTAGDGDVQSFTAGTNVVVLTQSGSAWTPWQSSWNTELIADRAKALVAAYLTALDDPDPSALLDLLLDPGEIVAAEYAVPGLDTEYLHGWTHEGGAVAADRLADTVAYLRTIESAIEIDQCASGVVLSSVDRVNTSCDYIVDSRLLQAFGLEHRTGVVAAAIEDDRLLSVRLLEDPSEVVWDMLSAQVDLDRGFNAATAVEHLAAVEEVLASVLRPGATTRVSTIFGEMEWTWLDENPLDVDYLGSATWSDLGFAAVGIRDSQSELPEIEFLTSPNGRDWTVHPFPAELESLWELRGFAEGVIGQVYREDTIAVAYFDGNTWTVIDIPSPENAVYLDFADLAVSGDTALVVGGWWTDTDGTVYTGTAIDADLNARPVPVPAFDDAETPERVTGSATGFVLGTSTFGGDSPAMSVWYSSDGSEWDLVADLQRVVDAQYFWNVAQHRSRYFVVGEGAEMRCTTDGSEESCYSLVAMWSSPDGAAWDRVITDTGEPVAAYGIGDGPLGLVAFSQHYDERATPRPVYVSADGVDWGIAGGLSLLNNTAEWWWIDEPAVGVDAVIAVGAAFDTYANTSEPEPFVIIGRLVDDGDG